MISVHRTLALILTIVVTATNSGCKSNESPFSEQEAAAEIRRLNAVAIPSGNYTTLSELKLYDSKKPGSAVIGRLPKGSVVTPISASHWGVVNGLMVQIIPQSKTGLADSPTGEYWVSYKSFMEPTRSRAFRVANVARIQLWDQVPGGIRGEIVMNPVPTVFHSSEANTYIYLLSDELELVELWKKTANHSKVGSQTTFRPKYSYFLIHPNKMAQSQYMLIGSEQTDWMSFGKRKIVPLEPSYKVIVEGLKDGSIRTFPGSPVKKGSWFVFGLE